MKGLILSLRFRDLLYVVVGVVGLFFTTRLILGQSQREAVRQQQEQQLQATQLLESPQQGVQRREGIGEEVSSLYGLLNLSLYTWWLLLGGIVVLGFIVAVLTRRPAISQATFSTAVVLGIFVGGARAIRHWEVAVPTITSSPPVARKREPATTAELGENQNLLRVGEVNYLLVMRPQGQYRFNLSKPAYVCLDRECAGPSAVLAPIGCSEWDGDNTRLRSLGLKGIEPDTVASASEGRCSGSTSSSYTRSPPAVRYEAPPQTRTQRTQSDDEPRGGTVRIIIPGLSDSELRALREAQQERAETARAAE